MKNLKRYCYYVVYQTEDSENLVDNYEIYLAEKLEFRCQLAYIAYNIMLDKNCKKLPVILHYLLIYEDNNGSTKNMIFLKDCENYINGCLAKKQSADIMYFDINDNTYYSINWSIE